MVEHPAVNRGVVGSSPTSGATSVADFEAAINGLPRSVWSVLPGTGSPRFLQQQAPTVRRVFGATCVLPQIVSTSSRVYSWKSLLELIQ